MKKTQNDGKKLHQRYTKPQIVTPKVKYHKAVYLREDRPTSNGKYPVMLRVTINRKYFREQIPIELSALEFNATDYTVKIAGNKEQSHTLTRIIQKQLAKAEMIFNKYMIMDKPLTIDLFRQQWKVYDNRNDFITWANSEIEQLKLSRNKSTITVYKVVIDRIKEFAPALLFSDLSIDFIDRYDRFLKSIKLGINTQMKHHKTLKTFCNIARKRMLLFDDPYLEKKIQRIESDRTHISKQSLNKLIDLYSQNSLPQSKQQVLRTFLFSCYTGVRFSDCQILNQQNIVKNTLVFVPQKTQADNITVKMMLSESALSLIDKTGNLLPAISEQKTNAALKHIAKITEIPEALTFHTARHTFATMFILSGGGVETLRLLMGHSKIETTMIYVKLVNETKAQDEQMKKFTKFLKKGSA